MRNCKRKLSLSGKPCGKWFLTLHRSTFLDGFRMENCCRFQKSKKKFFKKSRKFSWIFDNDNNFPLIFDQITNIWDPAVQRRPKLNLRAEGSMCAIISQGIFFVVIEMHIAKNKFSKFWKIIEKKNCI